MTGHSSNLEEVQDIRMVLQRLCRAGGSVHLKHEAFEQDVVVYAEDEDRVILAVSDVQRGQWRLKPGSHLLLALEDRGRKYEAIIEMTGHGRFEGVESCAFTHPRVLKCLNAESLSDFKPDHPEALHVQHPRPGNTGRPDPGLRESRGGTLLWRRGCQERGPPAG